MKIELLDQNHVKIILSADELADSGLTYQTLDERDPRARELFFALIHKAGALLNRDFSSGSVRIEAYPYADGGCLLFLSHTPKEGSAAGGLCSPVAFCYPSLRSVIPLAAGIEAHFSHMLLQSALYRLGRYCALLLYPCARPDKRLISLLSQEGEAYTADSAHVPALLREYAQPILTENATAVLAAVSQTD